MPPTFTDAELAVHPAAEIFPLLAGAELDDLADDIRTHGLIRPIVLLDGAVLDGRNRLAACRLAGVEPRFEEWDGEGDPVAWVVSMNLKRRHLDTSQQSMVAARTLAYHRERAKERQGERHDLRPTSAQNCAEVQRAPEPPRKAVDDAARLLNVSPRTVEHAARVLDEGAPELVRAVDAGAVAVSAASEVATLPKAEQVEIVARGEREIIEAAKRIRAERQEKRRTERIVKLAEIATGNAPLALPARYPVLLADPPWEYEHAASDNRRIENHYPTMSLDAICALPVGDIVTDDAILFLWVTSPKLAEGMRVIESWGFTYRTSMVWVKDVIGMGYYARQRHELLLIATRGAMPVPAPSDRPDSVIEAPRAEHSAKPARAYEAIEGMYPSLPRVEMFARAPRHGWSSWGNQSQGAA